MAATIKISDTVNAVQPYLNWANLTIGVSNEPAITAANMTLQTIIGPPFRWPWNRATATFQMLPGVQDYNAALTNYGWLESVSIQPSAIITSATVVSATSTLTFTAANQFVVGNTVAVSGCTTTAFNGVFTITAATSTTFSVALSHANLTESEAGAKALSGKIYPVEIIWGSQGEATEQDRPTFISTQSSDESGTSYTFRFLPLPEQNYQVILTYQESPSSYTAMGNTWGIPDQLQYIYTYFFMFFMFDYFEDPRAARFRQLAVASLLARQSGLSLSDRNLFLGNWLPLMKEEESAAQDNQQGNQAKGL